jgi:hypothetical protein
MQYNCGAENKDLIEDNIFIFLFNNFQNRPTASGDIGCMLTYFS